MLQYDRIDFSEGTDINKTSESKECMLCHYWYFKDVGYKFQPCVCNACYAVSMMVYESKSIAILNAKGDDYRYILFVLEDKGVL